MKHIEPSDLLSLEQYEQQRTQYRAGVIEHKRKRRLLLGPEMSILFEDRETVRHQIQEILRAEKLSAPTAVAEEIAVYNELLPPKGSVTATLMIEISDAAEREVRRRDYVGLDAHLHLECGEQRWTAVFDPRGLHGDRIAVVQYITWTLGIEGSELLRKNAAISTLRCTHPRYGYSVPLGEALAHDLVLDLQSG
jgi:hypothetical protein